MKKYLLIVFFMIPFVSYAQLRTGLLFAGGLGFERNLSLKPSVLSLEDPSYNSVDFLDDYQFHVLLGYRFRIENNQYPRWFYDIDPLINAKVFKKITNYYMDDDLAGNASGHDIHLSLAVSSSVNYKIYKGFYAGAGLEPTCYVVSEGKKFDIPILLKIGYNINNKIDFAFNYRFGLTNTIDNQIFEKGQVSDLNISIFIPFTVNK